jgi:hypothetical protein
VPVASCGAARESARAWEVLRSFCARVPLRARNSEVFGFCHEPRLPPLLPRLFSLPATPYPPLLLGCLVAVKKTATKQKPVKGVAGGASTCCATRGALPKQREKERQKHRPETRGPHPLAEARQRPKLHKKGQVAATKADPISATLIQVGPLGRFINVSITKPIVSALKNCCI